MSSARRSASPSPGDLELLELLWPDRELTLAQAHAAIGRSVGYTTIQTRLDRLVAKGFATRSTERPARYRAAVSSSEAAALHLEPVVGLQGGQVVPLVAGLLEQAPLTADEITELKQLLALAETRAARAAKSSKARSRKPKSTGH